MGSKESATFQFRFLHRVWLPPARPLSSGSITMEVYTHANMEDKRAAMDALQEVFA